ncbi:MAG: YraN family protein [Desulfobacterales bacterium]
MLNAHQRFGKKGEMLASKLLKRRGYKILETNYKTLTGEIDIIAKDRDTLVFVEVKSRRSTRFGDPKFSITRKKKEKIALTALFYLKMTDQMNKRARFDVVTILNSGADPQIEIVKNAFEIPYG